MSEDEKLSVKAHESFVALVNEKYSRLDDENNRQNARIDLLEKSIKEINQLAIAVENIAISTENMAKELGKQGERLEAIEKEPGEKWKKAIWYIFTFVLGIILALVVSKIGLQ